MVAERIYDLVLYQRYMVSPVNNKLNLAVVYDVVIVDAEKYKS